MKSLIPNGGQEGQVPGAVKEGGKCQQFLSSVILAELCFFREAPSLTFLSCKTLTEMAMG